MSFRNNLDQSMMAELNVTPLVDVMLVLLVIFIVTAPLIVPPQSVKVNLPKNQVVVQDEQAQVIVQASGQLTLNNRVLDDKQLAAQLKNRSSDPKFQLQISADKSVPYGRISEIMALAQSSGVSKLSFVSLSQGTSKK